MPVVIVSSFILFVAVRLTFDPSEKLRFSRDPQAIARYKAKFGLGDPIPLQWWKWFKSFVTGDWGISSRTNGEVLPMITRAFGFTIQLIVWGVVLAAIVAISIGVYSAVRQYSVPDYIFTGLSYIGLSMPPFWFGLVAIQFFAFTLKDWLGLAEAPVKFVGLHTTGMSGLNLDYLRHLVLPVMTLTVQLIAEWSRYQRSSMLDVLNSDYVRTARAKGVPRRRVIRHHAMRNALGPLLTVIALESGLLFGGLVITERIFSIPGMGRLFLDSLQTGDAYALMGWFMVGALFVVTFNLLADLIVAALDPRVRLQ